MLDADRQLGPVVCVTEGQQQLEAVGILEGQCVLAPVGIGGYGWALSDAGGDGVDLRLRLDVEDEQRLGMRPGRRMRASRGQLEVRARPGHGKEDAVVAVVVDEASELREAHSV